jgi:hypothetical protein
MVGPPGGGHIAGPQLDLGQLAVLADLPLLAFLAGVEVAVRHLRMGIELGERLLKAASAADLRTFVRHLESITGLTAVVKPVIALFVRGFELENLIVTM